ncbi:MAG: hypothetical protein AAGH15_24745 [Myxococcota bacterium]
MACNREPPAQRGLEILLDELDALHERQRARVSLVVVPAAERPRMDPDVARCISQAWRLRDGQIACGAAWLRRSGFFAAAVRSIVTGVLHTRPSSATPIRVTDDGDDIAAFVERHDPGAFHVRELLDMAVE